MIGRLLPGPVVCMESALYCHGYTDRTPSAWTIAVSKVRLAYPPVKVHFWGPSLLDLGVTRGEVNGVSIRIYRALATSWTTQEPFGSSVR